MHLRNDFKPVIMAEKIMTVPIMSLDWLKCHVEYVIFYYGGKFLDVVREHFISSKMQVIVGSTDFCAAEDVFFFAFSKLYKL